MTVLKPATLLLALFLLIQPFESVAQTEQGSANSAVQIQRVLSVYIDCPPCDFNFLREEIPYVNYVRDPEQADVHLFVTSVQTSGGREYEFSFIGRRLFASIRYDLSYTADRNHTRDETREGITRVLKAGFMPYINQTPAASRITFGYEGGEEAGEIPGQDEDPWNYWVFEAYIGSVSLGLESNQTDFSSRWGFYADRVTDEWKFRLRPYFNYSIREIRRDEREDVRRTVKRHGFDSYVIKSLSDHWSVGIFGNYVTRNDQNLKHHYVVSPGLEYSLLPYELATRRAITLRYQLGFTYTDYFEETIYKKNEEHLMRQSLEASVDIQQPWGNVSGGLEGSHYFHDAALRRVEIFGRISVRIIEGLSLSLYTNFQMIQDQITLPAGDASLEDILLQQRQLATDFDFNGSIAVTYTFGSDFANIVNTRF